MSGTGAAMGSSEADLATLTAMRPYSPTVNSRNGFLAHNRPQHSTFPALGNDQMTKRRSSHGGTHMVTRARRQCRRRRGISSSTGSDSERRTAHLSYRSCGPPCGTAVPDNDIICVYAWTSLIVR